MPRFVLCLLITLELALVVWGARLHSGVIPDLPPPPTYTPVVNGSLTVIIGESATVRSDQKVLIDCKPLIENVTNLIGVINPRVTWRKNDIVLSNRSETNIIISQDGRFLIITATALRRGGKLGTSGLYTCTVCGGDSNIDCLNGSSRQIVCGEPHLVPPVSKTVEPSQFLITLICGQDVTVPTLDGVLTIIINCDVFNGSEPFTITVYEDDTIVGNSVPHFVTDPKFATYTVVVTTEDCGATRASSRILQEGDPPSINTTMTEKPTTMPENKRVNVGSAVNIASGAILTIDCIATGTPPITIVWISGHDILQLIQGNSTSSTVSSTITRTVTNTTDGDNITCRADNNIGFDEATTTINVDVAELCFINGTYEFYEDQDLLCINLTLNKPAPCNMTVEVIEESVTATRGLDYESGPYFVNFAKGDKSAKLYINIMDDNELEMNEEFTLRINKSAFCPDVSLAKSYEAKVIIMDNEYKFCFGQSSYLVKERGEVIFPVSLNRPLRKDITVNFTYVDLTATGNHTITNQKIDYYTSHEYPNVAFIPAGNTQFNLSVRIEDDRRLEDSEIFRIITDPPDLPEGELPCVTDVIIRDDDDFRVTFDEASYTVRENEDITIGLSLIYPDEYDPSVIFPINVTIDEIDDSAIGGFHDKAEGADYVYQNYSYSFEDGEKKKSLIIHTIDDDVVEPDESYILFINTPTKGPSPAPPVSRVIVGENGTATITIVNDDDCSVTVVRGSIKLNNRRKRAKLRFSSDGDPIVAYECKLDDKNFKECKSPKVWKNLKKGKHVVTVRAFCTDDKGNRSTISRRKFNFRIR